MRSRRTAKVWGFNPAGEDEIPSLLKELNETAIYALTNDDNENALECLKRAEQLLEVITSEGKDVDRNLIIIVLYNIACCYQRLGMLEECVSYLDGTVFNLKSKITEFEHIEDNNNKRFNISSKMQKLRYQCKTHL
jgi:hypothetical protein